MEAPPMWRSLFFRDPIEVRVLSWLLCSCSQAGMDPVPEFIKRFPGLSWLVVVVGVATSRATP